MMASLVMFGKVERWLKRLLMMSLVPPSPLFLSEGVLICAVPGYGNKTTNNLRLWSAKPTREFDLEKFNTGDYESSVREQQRAETISAVLYPNDNVEVGKGIKPPPKHPTLTVRTPFETTILLVLCVSLRHCPSLQKDETSVVRVPGSNRHSIERYSSHTCDCRIATYSY
jgi:hypothetical protein